MLVGVHEFSGAAAPDLLVQNQVTGEGAVWLMATPEAVWAARSIGTAGDPTWKIAGVYD